MSYKIFPSDDGKYIILEIRGDITSKEIVERIQEAHKLGDEMKITRHLMDLTEARNIDSVTKIYKFAYTEIRRSPDVNLNARVAVLVDPDDHSHDFSETVIKNAGQNVTFFRDRDSAIRHLLK